METSLSNVEDLLRQLAKLKLQERALTADIRAVSALLSHHLENGELDDFRTDSENTYLFEDSKYVYSSGRVTWNYDNCYDVIAARENLKELESVAQSAGLATRKQGKPFFSVR